MEKWLVEVELSIFLVCIVEFSLVGARESLLSDELVVRMHIFV